MWRADSFEKTLMLGKIEGRRRRRQQRMRWLDGTTNSMDMRGERVQKGLVLAFQCSGLGLTPIASAENSWPYPLPSLLKESEVTQSCPTLCDPVDYSLPGSSIHGIFQARMLEWVAISFSRRSSQPRDWSPVSCIAGRHFTLWASREVLYGAWRRINNQEVKRRVVDWITTDPFSWRLQEDICSETHIVTQKDESLNGWAVKQFFLIKAI